MNNLKLSSIWISVWCVFFAITRKEEYLSLLCGKGIKLLNGQYYRLFTGLLLHVNVFHLLSNSIALYWVGEFLEKTISIHKLLMISIISGIIEEIIFSYIFPYRSGYGGSPVIFGLIGFLTVQQLLGGSVIRWEFGTVYSNWIIGYALLANIPVFSKDISALICHSIAFAVGCCLSGIDILLKFI